MRVHFEREVERLKRQVLALSAKVEEEVRAAVKAVEESDAELARAVLIHEQRVDDMDIDVEEECLKILALHQPVAGDLRYVVAVLKIDQDLERVSDLAAHIAGRALTLCEMPRIAEPTRLGEMGERTQNMLRSVLDAFVNMDAVAAHAVCTADAVVDDIHRQIVLQVKRGIARDPSKIEQYLHLMHISRHLERIADHATNIAEDLIYMIEGRIVRHSPEVSDHPIARSLRQAGTTAK